MTQVSDRIKALEVSPTLSMAQKSRELKAQGIDVISLSVGEPDFDTPTHIKEAAKQAIDDNHSHYTPVPGYAVLLEAIVNKLKRENDLSFETEQIVVSCGAKHSIYNLFQCLINPGDEVIIPCPFWVSYSEISKLAGGINVFIETGMEQDFKMSPAQLEAAITPKTKAVIFSSPSNPTGSLYSKEELQALASVLEKHPHVFVISDEIYEHINYESQHQSIAQFPAIKNQVAIVNGVSKGYAMTGWRIGYIAAPHWLAKACNKLQGQVTSGVTAVAQMAAVEALNGDMTATREMKKAFQKRRELAVGLLKDIAGFEVTTPKGAFYLFPKVSALFGKSYQGTVIENATDLSLFILDEAKVATVTGDAFGAPEYIRLSYATSEETIRLALTRIKQAIDKLS